MNPDIATCSPRIRRHQAEPVCLPAGLSAITHPAAAATSAMMMHEFYGRRAAWVSTCRRTSPPTCEWILVTVWRTRPHVPDTFPWAQCHRRRRQRRASLRRSWCWEERGGRREEEVEDRGVDQGQHRLCLDLAPALVHRSMSIFLWCDENSVSSRRFLQPRTRLTAYVHSQKSGYTPAWGIWLLYSLLFFPPFSMERLHVTCKQLLFLWHLAWECRRN